MLGGLREAAVVDAGAATKREVGPELYAIEERAVALERAREHLEDSRRLLSLEAHLTGWQAPQPYVTFEDFVASERDSETKHRVVREGRLRDHGRERRARPTGDQLHGGAASQACRPCTVLSSDVMLYVRETNLATYPDGCVVCGPVDVQQVVRNGKVIGEAITNPVLVIEVLSDSTESYDRGEKFAHYMRCPR